MDAVLADGGCKLLEEDSEVGHGSVAAHISIQQRELVSRKRMSSDANGGKERRCAYSPILSRQQLLRQYITLQVPRLFASLEGTWPTNEASMPVSLCSQQLVGSSVQGLQAQCHLNAEVTVCHLVSGPGTGGRRCLLPQSRWSRGLCRLLHHRHHVCLQLRHRTSQFQGLVLLHSSPYGTLAQL